MGSPACDPKSVQFEGTDEQDDEVVMVTKPLAERVDALKEEKSKTSLELRDVDLYRKFIQPKRSTVSKLHSKTTGLTYYRQQSTWMERESLLSRQSRQHVPLA